MPPAATKIELIDRLMDGKLREYVLSLRNRSPKRSWAGIAADIRVDYDIEVSDTQLRQTFGDETERVAS